MKKEFIVEGSPLLEVNHLSKSFPGMKRKAVNNVGLTLEEGTILALVGESGSGKSTLSRLLMGLTHQDEGRVVYDGHLLSLAAPSLRKKDKRAAPSSLEADFSSYYSELGIKEGTPLFPKRRPLPSLVFQDPYSSFDPRMDTYSSLIEPLIIQGIKGKDALKGKVLEALRMVGIDEDALSRYPFEFSGGQCQRLAIARALLSKAKLIVLDEPISSLDLSVQNEVLSLLKSLKQSRGLSYLFIAHSLPAVASFSDQIAVMSQGVIVEKGGTDEVLHNPLHPYTQSLLSHVPIPDPNAERKRVLSLSSFSRPIIEEGGLLVEKSPNHYVYEKEPL